MSTLYNKQALKEKAETNAVTIIRLSVSITTLARKMCLIYAAGKKRPVPIAVRFAAACWRSRPKRMTLFHSNAVLANEPCFAQQKGDVRQSSGIYSQTHIKRLPFSSTVMVVLDTTIHVFATKEPRFNAAKAWILGASRPCCAARLILTWL